MSLRRFHRTLGIVFFIPLFWICFTGTLLSIWDTALFKKRPIQIEMINQSPIYRVETLLGAGNQPPTNIKGIQFASDASQSDILKLKVGEDIAIHPNLFIVLDQEKEPWKEVRKIVVGLHRGKYFGTIGRSLWSAVALFIILLLVSGLFLVRWRWEKIRFHSRSIHRNLGILAALPLGILFVTGGVWNFSEEIRGERKEDKIVAPINWKSSLQRAIEGYTGESKEVSGIYEVGGKVLVYFKDAGRVYLDGTQISIHDPGKMSGWLEFVFRLHYGKVWGEIGPWVVFLSGLLGMVISISGLIFWQKTFRMR